MTFYQQKLSEKGKKRLISTNHLAIKARLNQNLQTTAVIRGIMVIKNIAVAEIKEDIVAVADISLAVTLAKKRRTLKIKIRRKTTKYGTLKI